MVRTLGRKSLWAYALLLLVMAVGYARFDLYIMDGDGTAFLDIAQYLNTHRAGLAINGYWNPGYPAVLATAERLVHPSLWRELTLLRYTNVVIFAFAMAACIFFTTGLTKARAFWCPGIAVAVPDDALHLLGLALLTLSLGRELPVAAPRSDTLLFMLLMLAAGLLVRHLSAPRKLWIYTALGVTLGLAYLTKSFAFLPSLALIAALGISMFVRVRDERRAVLLGVLIFATLFAAIAGPYILAISKQLGHLTTGESARLNYAFFVDLTGRWHEWYHHDLGHAGGIFLHPEAVLATNPPTFSFAAHPVGTFPLWFDPAWWTLGIKPHLWLKGHLLRLARNLVVFVRYVLGRPEIFVLLAVLLAFGATWPWRRLKNGAATEALESESRWRTIWYLAPIVWGALMLLIYLPIDLQDRYLTAPLFLMALPLFASLRSTLTTDRSASREIEFAFPTPVVANALILLFAGIALTQAITYIAERRRHTPVDEQQHAGYDPQIFTAAAALNTLGLRPGEKIACMGDLACYTDHYWARLAGTQILAEVETPDDADPLAEWNSMQDKHAITAPLAGMGLRYIVSLFPNSGSKPAGWVQLGNSNFFAYPLQAPFSEEQSRRIAAFQATP